MLLKMEKNKMSTIFIDLPNDKGSFKIVSENDRQLEILRVF